MSKIITGKLMPEAKPRALTCDLRHSLFPREVSILFFLIPSFYAESNIFVKTSGRKNLLSAGVLGKNVLCFLVQKFFSKSQ